MRITSPTSLLLLAFALVAGTVGAASPQPEYRVDMILFTQKGYQGNEDFGAYVHAPDQGDVIDLDHAPSRTGFRAVEAANGDMQGVLNRLKRSSRYRVIGHWAWEQPGLGPDAARRVLIRGGSDHPALLGSAATPADAAPYPSGSREIDGNVRLVRQRYLHLYTDLIYRRPGTVDSGDGGGTRQALIEYPMSSERRMRSGELHYIDHPLVGILVRVTKLRGTNGGGEPEPAQGDAPPTDATEPPLESTPPAPSPS